MLISNFMRKVTVFPKDYYDYHKFWTFCENFQNKYHNYKLDIVKNDNLIPEYYHAFDNAIKICEYFGIKYRIKE